MKAHYVESTLCVCVHPYGCIKAICTKFREMVLRELGSWFLVSFQNALSAWLRLRVSTGSTRLCLPTFLPTHSYQLTHFENCFDLYFSFSIFSIRR